ncbi:MULTISPECIES: hypothetical protein [unclassified Nostoc]|nr:hypothetical protein [Nostoc sp. DedQUE03]MDZ7975935.1 hypothetical protein [Nostoc sp. DedQUE03]MDZ8044770.1 hypothetical protein [Nostoc sp. DedQUE02]
MIFPQQAKISQDDARVSIAVFLGIDTDVLGFTILMSAKAFIDWY